jgi:hypothetical protein
MFVAIFLNPRVDSNGCHDTDGNGVTGRRALTHARHKSLPDSRCERFGLCYRRNTSARPAALKKVFVFGLMSMRTLELHAKYRRATLKEATWRC